VPPAGGGVLLGSYSPGSEARAPVVIVPLGQIVGGGVLADRCRVVNNGALVGRKIRQ